MNVTGTALRTGTPYRPKGARVETSSVDPPAPAPVDAWRVFGVDPGGTLFAPFGPIYWPDAPEGLRLWQSVAQVAGCVAEDHPAPAEDCTCGIRGVVDRDVLIASAGERRFAGAENTVMADAGVIGKVRLEGGMLPGVRIPDDDPPTTLRAERGTLLELHLGPAQTAVAPRVATRYPSIPVFTYDDADWIAPAVEGEPAGQRVEPGGPDGFWAEVERAGFGTKNLGDPAAPAALLAIGRSVCDILAKGASPEDVGSVLFDLVAAPTWGQCKALVRAAIDHLCPNCVFGVGASGYQHARQITRGEILERTAQNMVAAFGGAGTRR